MRADTKAQSKSLADSMSEIYRNAKLRRELLWLRAMEKGDEDSVRDLEKVDPGLRDRVDDVIERAETGFAEDAAEVYGRAYIDLLERHLE